MFGQHAVVCSDILWLQSSDNPTPQSCMYLYVVFVAEQNYIFWKRIAANYHWDDMMIFAPAVRDNVEPIQLFMPVAAPAIFTIVYLLCYPTPRSRYIWSFPIAGTIPNIDRFPFLLGAAVYMSPRSRGALSDSRMILTQ